MNEIKHNPGPWTIGEPEGAFVDINAMQGRVPHSALARVVWCMEGDERSPQKEANARLIAAAPDLLNALKEILETDFSQESSWDYSEGIKDVARAAIAKAEGRS